MTAKMSVALRNKGEELIRQRFGGLRKTIEAKRRETVETLQSRVEATTELAKLRDRKRKLDEERDRLQSEYNQVCHEVIELEARVNQQTAAQAAQLSVMANAMEMKLRDQENDLVEKLWMESLDTDLRGLVDQVPSTEYLLSNGFGQEIARLNGRTVQA